MGGDKTIRSDVRVIAATNKNLEQAVEAGTFREDLYYRLNVFPIYYAAFERTKNRYPASGRPFSGKIFRGKREKHRRFSTPAINMLIAYHWPGNVRELENCIERAVLLCTMA